MNPALDFLAKPVFHHVEVIGRLEVHPEFRTGGEIAAEPKRGVGADAAFGVEDLADPVGRNAELERELVAADAACLDFAFDDAAGVYGHGHGGHPL